MLHVVDAASLLTLADVVIPAQYHETLDNLTDLVQEERLTFPAEVVQDLERRARGEFLYTWIKAVAPSRVPKSVAHRNTQWVMGKCAALCDYDALIDSPSAVAAMARSLDSEACDFHVVTDDLLDKPTRLALGAACDDLGWYHETIAEFLMCVGLSDRLR